jgi:hypothetical protein
MTTISAPVGSSRLGARHQLSDPVFQAFALLRIGFVVAPILFGIDKFAHVLVNWDIYLAPRLNDIIPGTAHQAMYAVGVIEIVAGLVVAIRPRYGSLLVSAWLTGIIVNLLLIPGYYDIALRDFGLLLAALTLYRLATAFDRRPLLSLDTLLNRGQSAQ